MKRGASPFSSATSGGASGRRPRSFKHFKRFGGRFFAGQSNKPFHVLSAGALTWHRKMTGILIFSNWTLLQEREATASSASTFPSASCEFKSHCAASRSHKSWVEGNKFRFPHSRGTARSRSSHSWSPQRDFLTDSEWFWGSQRTSHPL